MTPDTASVLDAPAPASATPPSRHTAFVPAPAAPRRVLMTADPVGGIWTYMLVLARALIAAGVEVVVASMGAPVSASQRVAFERLGPRATLHENHRRLEWMDNPWDDVAATGDWLLELERKHRPDLVHLNGYAHASLPWRAPVVVVAHACVYSWWRAVHHCYPPPIWHRYHESVARGLRAARLVVAPTRAMLSALVAQYGELPAARVIPNGRDPLPSPGLLRENVVLGVGRLWDEAKNLRALADVAPSLPYPWTVRLAGAVRSPGGDLVNLPGVELLGQLPDHSLGAHFDRATIYALPARYEPFGLSVLEAALAGCALVLGDIPSLRENWDGAAIFVAPDDRVALRAAILDLINHPAIRGRLVAEAKKRAALLTPARMSAAYLDAYAHLVGARLDRALSAPPFPSPPSGFRPQASALSSTSPQPEPALA